MEQQRSIVDLLRNKDEQDDQLAEQFAEYDWVARNKNKWFVLQEERFGFTKRLMKQCVGPCINNLETTVISNEEAECFTNCMGKGQAIGSMFQYLNADAEIKRYGGYKA